MRFLNDPIMSALDASVDQTSSAIDASQMFAGSATVVITGASTGTLKIQASNDAGPPKIPSKWADVPSATSTITTAGTTLIAKFDIAYQWLQFVWTKNNGSAGTITVNLKSNGF